MKEIYNEIPVYYCTHCLSLAILSLPDGTDYCMKCGATNIETNNIEEWKKLYNNKFKGEKNGTSRN